MSGSMELPKINMEHCISYIIFEGELIVVF